MNMKKTFLLKSICIVLSLFVASSSFAQKKKVDKSKFLEGKKYTVKFYDIKPTGRGKAIESEIVFKDGKIDCELMDDKLKIEKTIYRVTLDSTYTEDETESRLIKIEASYSKDKDDATWEATITNFDIEGTIVEKKNGVEKKKYEFSGAEKAKKK